MNKDTLIALIEKDIAELQTLTQGFAEMETFPQPLIDLAVTKVESLRHCLTAMPEAARDSVRTEPEMPAPVPDEVPVTVTEPAAVVEPEPTLIVEPEPIPEVCEDVDNQPDTDVATPDETAAQIVAETIHKPETVVDAFAKQQEAASVAATIAHRPVTDLKRAISIADRFRFQRELFDNNGEQMATVLDALNQCTSLEQAEAYLEKHCALPPDKPATTDFVDLIKRRFA
ncbi:MAG: hypothetical protein PUK04_04310 [Bacteroidales bacterium]|nr:hypothetical protein [Bacteroidales bacterium]